MRVVQHVHAAVWDVWLGIRLRRGVRVIGASDLVVVHVERVVVVAVWRGEPLRAELFLAAPFCSVERRICGLAVGLAGGFCGFLPSI